MKIKVIIILVILASVLLILFLKLSGRNNLDYGEIILYEWSRGAVSIDYKGEEVISKSFMPGFVKLDDDRYITYAIDETSNDNDVIQYINKGDVNSIPVKDKHSIIVFNKYKNTFYYLDGNILKKVSLDTFKVDDVIELECGENYNDGRDDSFYINKDESVVYYIERGGDNNLIRRDIISGKTRVIDQDVDLFDVSENGKFVYQKTGTDNFSIYLYDEPSNHISKITSEIDRSSNDIAVSKNGEYILYNKHKYFWFYENGKDELYVYNVITKKEDKIYTTESHSQLDYYKFSY